MGLEFGDCAAVIGAGLVGQIAVQLLGLAGIRALAFDYNAGRLELCRYAKAEMAWNLGDGGPAEAVLELTRGRGCDGVLIAAATDSSEPFALAAALARDRARISLVGVTGTEFSYRDFMSKELSLVVSRSYGPGRYDEDYEGRGMKYPVGYVPWTETRNLEEVVRRMTRQSDHRLAVEQLITHRFRFADAEQAYAMVTDNTEPHLGVILNYDTAVKHTPSVLRIPISVSGGKAPAGCVLGVIGAGNFARSVLLPALKKIADCRLHTLATQRGMTAQYGQETFGFEVAAADEAAVLENDEINSVLIATTHSSHAALTAAALEAGKNVLVEKPLALDRDQLNAVIEARNRSDTFFQVGFNRRFASMAVAARDRLASTAAPKVVLLRVNAGQLPAQSWQKAPEEGHGRILGEVCHFVDLARFLIGAPVATVHAAAATATRDVCDDVTATLTFSDGSLATIAYTAKGDAAFSKELVECYAGGTVFVIDNFRTATLISDGKEKSAGSGLDQDKGHADQLKAFVTAVATGGRAPVDEAELIETSLATIAIGEALRNGAPVNL
jgi:predicted dehydrogenase